MPRHTDDNHPAEPVTRPGTPGVAAFAGGQSADAVPLRNRSAALGAAFPLLAGTGAAADKAFLDELSGDL